MRGSGTYLSVSPMMFPYSQQEGFVKSSKSAISATVVLGICSLTLSVRADVFTPNFPVTERHGANGANSSNSLATSSLMGGQGHSNLVIPFNAEATLTTSCTSNTPSTSVWPSVCNPTGMATALSSFTGRSWVTFTFASTDQASALNNIVTSLRTFRSPGVIPIYGQADHWVAIIEVSAVDLGGGVFSVQQVKAYDGGPIGQTDSGGSGYLAGLQIWGATPFKNLYFKVITAINPSCDNLPGGCGAPPTSDPFYDKFVLMYEPPPNAVHPFIETVFEKSPGIVPAGHNAMNEHLAQMRLWDSLVAAGINNDPKAWNTLSGGVPGPASLVNAVYPDGSPWDYYLVPILSSRAANTVIAFAALSADDGSFDHLNVLAQPAPFTSVSMTGAAQLASGALARGERLTGGTLTWDPRTNARSPSLPYYEFGVAGTSNRNAAVRVQLHDGRAVRVQ
jgi:hypothetical protein